MTLTASSKILKEISRLDAKKRELVSSLDQVRGRKIFFCECCGHKHTIRQCTVIQTHWYTQPSGCTEGDYWSSGELKIICPVTDHANRVLFNTNEVDWSLRNNYEYSADMQFQMLYRHLFKEVIQDYKEDRRPWINTYYFDQHRSYFDLLVKGVDPEPKVK